jgi:carboxypeptidase Taq
MFTLQANRGITLKNNIKHSYRKLLEKIRDITVLGTTQSVIHWDMETMMPSNAVEQRSLQLELLSRIGHQMSTSSEIGKFLQQIQTASEYSEWGEVERRNVYLINKNYLEQISLPEKLVAEMAKQETITVNTWKRAKAKKDYGLVKVELKKLFELSRQAAEILMDVKGVKTPYEVLIDQFEPQMSVQKITDTFDKLQTGLRPLLNKVQEESYKHSNMEVLCQSVPVEVQRQISQLITRTLGYDTVSPVANGRIDETEHPFTSGSFQDVRITTHYYVNDYPNSIFSVLHESGHALYELNVNPEWRYQPVGGTCSYGIHESQSRFYENIVGRSKEFWQGFLPNITVVNVICVSGATSQ